MPVLRRNTSDPALDQLLTNLDLAADFAAPAGARALPEFTATLREQIGASLAAAVGIAGHAPQLALIAAQTEDNGQQLAQASEQMASASEQVSTTVGAELAPGAAEVAQLAGAVRERLAHCGKDADQVLQQMSAIDRCETQLGEEVQRMSERLETVTEVIDMIAGIAEQTNLLALNAAIEAARAGEQGRGFTVVADEVRRLAGQSTEATSRVSDIISRFREGMTRLGDASGAMHDAVGDGRQGVERMATDLTEANQAMEDVDQRMTDIASGTEQIGAATRSVSEDVQRVAGIAGQLREDAGRIREHSQAVRSEGDALLEGLGVFRLAVHRQLAERVVDLVADPVMLASVDQAEQRMRDILTQDNRFELLYLVDVDGHQLSENIFAPALADHEAGASMKGTDWRGRAWFQQVLDSRNVTITPVYRSSATDAFCFTLSAPIFDQDGRLRRILGTDVRLDALLEHSTVQPN